MANTRLFSRSFAGGELAPELFGRIDDPRYQVGLAKCRNFIIKPHGPAVRRPGTLYVNATKEGAAARLIPFTYSADQAYAVEVGSLTELEFTAATVGATITIAGTPWVASAFKGLFVECGGSIAAVADNTSNEITLTAGWTGGTPTVLAVKLYLGYFRFHAGGDTLAAPAATAWSGGTNYASGELASDAGITYFARQASTSASPKTPATNPDYWYPMPATGEYEIPHSYAEAHLFQLTYAQSFDVMTITHLRYPHTELSRLSATAWQHARVVIAPTLTWPVDPDQEVQGGVKLSIVQATAVGTATTSTKFRTAAPHNLIAGDIVYIEGTTQAAFNNKFWAIVIEAADPDEFRLVDPETGVPGPAGAAVTSETGTVELVPPFSIRDNYYVATAVSSDGTESAPSPELHVINNLFASGASNTVQWDTVTGAARYRIYKKQSGLFGLIGEVEHVDGSPYSFTFLDDNIEPDLGFTPPVLDESLSGTDYPSAVGYFEQRRCFGGSYLEPRGIWMTRTGAEDDLSFHLPAQDTDRIFFRIAARQLAPIRHLVPLNQLLVLTPSTEFRVSPVNNDALTPSSVAARPQSYIGANYVQPAVVNNSVLFCADRGGHVRELGFRLDADGFVTGDLSLRAPHLFDGLEIVDLSFQKAPFPIAWFVSSNGRLLGLTYVPEEQVGAWHWHDTDGEFESVCVISEGTEDRVYVVVKRTINGSVVRYVERFAPFALDHTEDAVFVDSAITFEEVTAFPIGGVDHLIGEEVQILGNGIVLENQTVDAAGELANSSEYDKVTVGLPITAQLQTLPVIMQVDGYAQGRVKNVNWVAVRVVDSCSFSVGPAEDSLSPSDTAAASVNYLPIEEQMDSQTVRVRIEGTWSDDGQVFIEQTFPLPLTVVGLTIEVALGG